MRQSDFNLATHPINHALDQLDLAVAEPVLVADVVRDAGLATALAAGATGLNLELLATSLGGRNIVYGFMI